MIFAKHVTDGSFVIEAFEYGVALPFVRTADAAWRPMALTVEALQDNYVDIRENTDQCSQMIGAAYEASRFILRHLHLSQGDAEKLNLRAIHARMMASLGAIDVTAEMIERARPAGIRAEAAAIVSAVQAKGFMN